VIALVDELHDDLTSLVARLGSVICTPKLDACPQADRWLRHAVDELTEAKRTLRYALEKLGEQ
jgi:hypothetical protein